jgi:hypothetical protein
VRASRGDILAFTDDDCLADRHWPERSDAEVDALRRGYAIGRWAFVCKRAARFDRHVARNAAHDL